MSVESCIEWQNRFVMNAEFEWVLKEGYEESNDGRA